MKSKDREYKNKSLKDLRTQEKMLREEIAKLTLERVTSGTKDTNVIYKKRKSLAVILTLITEKEEIDKLQA